tara:strand:+ start:5108 stop:5971 length:864 start_codon:yes stop_codon:yes gene_type:complete
MSKIYLTRTSGQGKSYYISNLNNLNWSIDTPVTPMPLPEDTHEENILVKMEGNTAKIDLSWTMDTGSYFGTLSKNSASPPVWTFEPEGSPDIILTALQQINEFKKFVPKSIGDAYNIMMISDSGIEENKDEGTISNMGFSVSGGSPIVWNVNLAFYIGKVVAMLEADIPNAPTSAIMVGSTGTSAGAGTISFTVVPYDGYAVVPAGAAITTGMNIKYQIANGTWEETELTNLQLGTPLTQSITGQLTGLPHGEYQVKIAQLNGYSADASTEYYRTAATTTSSTVTVG